MTLYKEIEEIFSKSFEENIEIVEEAYKKSPEGTGAFNPNHKDIFDVMIIDLLNFIERVYDKFRNIVLNMNSNHDQFKKDLQRAIKAIEPQEKIKVYAYKYDLKVLKQLVDRFNKGCDKIYDAYRRRDINSPLYRPYDEFMNYFIKEIGYVGSIDSISDYFSEVKEKFRGSKMKREITLEFKKSHDYINFSLTYPKELDFYNDIFNDINNITKSLKKSARNEMDINKYSKIFNENNLKNQYRNISSIIRFQSSMITYAKIMISEYDIFCRQVSTKFYILK